MEVEDKYFEHAFWTYWTGITWELEKRGDEWYIVPKQEQKERARKKG